MASRRRLAKSILHALQALCVAWATSLSQAEPRVTPIATLKFGAPTFFSKLDGWAPGRGNSLWHTADGGQTWFEVKVGLGNSAATEIHGVYFQSAVEAWIMLTRPDDTPASAATLAVTRDGGLTWKQEVPPDPDWTGEVLTTGPEGSHWLGGEMSRQGDSPNEKAECPQRVSGSAWDSSPLFPQFARIEMGEATVAYSKWMPGVDDPFHR
jgi:hypothetical protein